MRRAQVLSIIGFRAIMTRMKTDTRGMAPLTRGVLKLIVSWVSGNLFGGKLRAAHLVQTLLSHIEYGQSHDHGVLRHRKLPERCGKVTGMTEASLTWSGRGWT